MKGNALLVMTCALTGCAMQPSSLDRDLAEYRETDRRNLFADTATICRRAGGYMIVKTNGRLPRNGLPRPGDAYSCTRPALSR